MAARSGISTGTHDRLSGYGSSTRETRFFHPRVNITHIPRKVDQPVGSLSRGTDSHSSPSWARRQLSMHGTFLPRHEGVHLVTGRTGRFLSVAPIGSIERYHDVKRRFVSSP